MGWWKSVKDWYVRLNKVKKRYTDREQFMTAASFTEHSCRLCTGSAPMVSLQRSEPIPQESVDSEPDSDQEPLDDLQVAERTSARDRPRLLFSVQAQQEEEEGRAGGGMDERPEGDYEGEPTAPSPSEAREACPVLRA